MNKATLLICAVVMILIVACADGQPRAAVQALAEGDLEQARRIYASGVHPDRESDGFTALTAAACHAAPQTVELLLEFGADPNLPSSSGLSPLVYAVRCGNLPVVRLLLDAGADVNFTLRTGETVLSAAQAAGNDEVTKLLLDAGAIIVTTSRRRGRLATGY